MATENPTAAAEKKSARVMETRADGTTPLGANSPDTGTHPRPDAPAGPVWDALTANSGASVTAIATAAGVSTAAARRVLTELESGGHATRTQGRRVGGKRAPDAWHASRGTPVTDPADGADAITDADSSATSTTTTDGDTRPTAEARAQADATTGEKAPLAAVIDGDDDPPEGMAPASVAEARAVLTALGESIISAVDALITGDRAAALTAAEEIYAGSGKARRLVRTAARGRPRTSSGRVKSLPGELRAKVAAHLAAYPGAEFTPHEVGKVIGHSAGAISNALDRLVSLDQAAQTCDRPRRFTAAHTTEDAATATLLLATA